MIHGPTTVIYNSHLSNIHPSARFGNDCKVHSPVWVGEGFVCGDRCKIQAFAFMPEGVSFEDDVFIGPGVKFANDPKLKCKGRDFWSKTLVKKGAKIGMGALINAGVTIGEYAVIGMGAVVLKDVPAGETWVGNPARKVHNKV